MDSNTGHLSAPAGPVVIGIFGLPGSGNRRLLSELQQRPDLLPQHKYKFIDMSNCVVQDIEGRATFPQMTDEQIAQQHSATIRSIQASTSESEVAVIADNYYSVWREGRESGKMLWDKSDAKIYTYIIYLSVPAETILQNAHEDASVSHLRHWQNVEVTELQNMICEEYNIEFSKLTEPTTLVDDCALLLREFNFQWEEDNLESAKQALDRHFGHPNEQLESMLVLDTGRTLAAIDIEKSFNEKVQNSTDPKLARALKLLKKKWPSGPLTYAAQRRIASIYQAFPKPEFEALCEQVAAEVMIHPEMFSLLQMVGEHKERVGAVLFSRDRRVWEKVLAMNDFSDVVKVVADGRLEDNLLVTDSVKETLVDYLRRRYQVYVVAVRHDILSSGDDSRDEASSHAIQNEHLTIRQASPPDTETPEWNENAIPITQLTARELITSIFNRDSTPSSPTTIQVYHATHRTIARLLATAVTNESVTGPALRAAHQRIGCYLGAEIVSPIIGIQKYAVKQTEKGAVFGFRTLDEGKTLIIAMMRAGELMAFGINEALPGAALFHANQAGDVETLHLRGRVNVVLVDYEMGGGERVIDFIKHIRGLHATIRIIVVVAFIHSDAMARLREAGYANVRVVAMTVEDGDDGEGCSIEFGEGDVEKRLFGVV